LSEGVFLGILEEIIAGAIQEASIAEETIEAGLGEAEDKFLNSC